MKIKAASFQQNNVQVKLEYGSGNAGHNKLLISLVVLNCLAFIVMIFLNAASSIPSIGIFSVPQNNISDKFPTEITPAGATFSTWGIIYAWQALWLIFNIFVIFKKTDSGYLYQNPMVFTSVFHIFIFFNFVANIVWLFVWAETQMSASFAVLVCITGTLYAAIFFSHKNIHNAEADLQREKIYLWLYRVLVNNGLAFYVTWVTIATMLNLAIAIEYEWFREVNNIKETASLVALSILTIIIVVYFILDVFIFEEYTRFTYSSYAQMAIAFAGILSKHNDLTKPVNKFSLSLAIIGPGLMLIVKIIFSILKAKRAKK